eukprot:m.42614 g.42614  ORF g.42614 m.42614 type:complete len:277 (+) comp10709_c0_seq4:166-996(+)
MLRTAQATMVVVLLGITLPGAIGELCNTNRPECGFLNNRQCPDPSSAHPTHLDTCCSFDRLGCATACCASSQPAPYASIAALCTLMVICVGFPLLMCCCRRCRERRHHMEQAEWEQNVADAENAFDREEHLRRLAMSEPAPPNYYGPNVKTPSYEEALGDQVLEQAPGLDRHPGYSRRASNASILHPAAGGAVPTRDSMVSLSPTPSSPSAQLHSSAVALEPQSQQVSFATSPVASLPITATEQAQRLDEEPASALASTSVVLQIQDSGAEPESRA